MKAIRVPAPAGLPDGDVDLCLADEPDDLDAGSLAELDAALVRAAESIKAGRYRPVSDVLAELRDR